MILIFNNKFNNEDGIKNAISDIDSVVDVISGRVKDKYSNVVSNEDKDKSLNKG
jgi:hypothetical protein